MSRLQKLRAAQTLEDVAFILGFKPRNLAYILYKVPDHLKYRSFEIPKRSGGMRLIRAPSPPLRILQRQLATVLYDCLDEIGIGKGGKGPGSFAHGFQRKRSIITNASMHKRRRYVLNLDLEDFFPSINFGRVRGFFIKDKYFALNQKVATILAQIACRENELPQGGPCSPVVSNLIGHILDSRLAGFAKSHKCTYSRYADDITFSTNQKEFPTDLAAPSTGHPSVWELGAALVSKIELSGFRINTKKTRMQYRGSRQVVTGLLVNEKVNIRPEYWRTARAMCNQLFSTGEYYKSHNGNHGGLTQSDAPASNLITDLEVLQGTLGHIYQVKTHSESAGKSKSEKNIAVQALYHRFLFFKHFVALQAPVIVPEGKTDSIYLRAAMRKSPEFHPRLGRFVDSRFVTTVNIFNYNQTTVRDILHLGSGSSPITNFIFEYKHHIKRFRHAPLLHPVILVIDNDDGGTNGKVFKAASKQSESTVSLTSTEPYYHIYANLYLIKTPEMGPDCKSCIEDLFDAELKNTRIAGKSFDPGKEHEAEGKYGKFIFAEKVIKPRIEEIDFSRFKSLLFRIQAAIDDYAERKATKATA